MSTKDWRSRCVIIPNYMPPYPRPDTRPTIQVSYGEDDRQAHTPFLRVAPKEGGFFGPPGISSGNYFWDVYGTEFASIEEAQAAIAAAPPPSRVLIELKR
jgi:hypothetical protein